MSNPPKTTFLGVAMGAFAAFGGFLYGYDTGYISGVKEMQSFLRLFGKQDANGEYFLPAGTDSLVTSILSAGTFCGALIAYPIGDRLGRRMGICTFLALFCIGVALQTSVNNSTANPEATFVVGRVFAGLGVGGTSCLVPTYQAEVSPKHLRGAIVSCYQWMITIGLLIAACIVEGTRRIDSVASYQIPIGLQFIWAAILAGGLIMLPESPRWLVLKGRVDEAHKAISRITGNPMGSEALLVEAHDMQASIEHELSQSHGASYLDCFRKADSHIRLRVLTGMSLQALQQLSGINFIFYGTSFFKSTGINGFTTTIITNVVNVVMTIPGILLVDRLGRRNMLLFGAAAMGVFQLLVAIIGVTVGLDGPGPATSAMIALICFFIATFAATWGILAWVVTSEIYPTAVRGKAMSLSTASNWLLNFAIGYATPYLVNSGSGNAGLHTSVFFIWGGCCVLAWLVVFTFVRETRQLSLEQVDLLYRNTNSVKEAKAYRQRIIDEDLHDMGAYVDEKALADKATAQHKDQV